MNFIRLLVIFVTIISCGQIPSWVPGSKKNQDTKATIKPNSSPEVTDTNLAADPVYNAAIVNNDYLKTSVNLDPWLKAGYHGKNLTIAILDNGFGGLKTSLGKRLPPDLKVEKSRIENESLTPHGTKLAEIIFAMTSGSPSWSATSKHPKFKLYNSNGFTNFSAAVDQAIEDRVDMIVYSQVWEFGGNFDGSGFINAAVNKATKVGILWINAAGNYAASVWQGPVLIQDNGSVLLPYKSEYVRLVVNDQITNVKITLSWNDFTDSKEWRTSRDLDLTLLDPEMKEIAASRRTQDGKDHGKDSNYSAHAREFIESSLKPGIYLLKVTAKSRNFDEHSFFRLSADGQNISFIDQSTLASVMIPADNPTVLTVGASDDDSSSAGSTMAGIRKPEFVAPSIIQVEGGMQFQGSSTAAAVAAATLAVYQEACGKLNRSSTLDKIVDGSIAQLSTKGRGLWLNSQLNCY